jgi:hypothetical protein
VSLLARAGELTVKDLETPRQKLTLMALADIADACARMESPHCHVNMVDLGIQTIQTTGELDVTIKRLKALGLISFAGISAEGNGERHLLDVVLHLPEASL